MAIRIKSTKDIRGNGVKCLVYGKSGVGKTTLMGTAPKPIIISCESGLLALKDFDRPYIEVNSIDKVYEAYEYIMSPKGRQFETICLDSMSEIAEVSLSEYKVGKKDPRNSYGEMADEMAKLIRKFRDIRGKNVVFSAKRTRMVDPDTGLTQYIPSVPGKVLPEGLAYFFDEVFYMLIVEDDEGNEQRALATRVCMEHDAKDRSGMLNEYERPNLETIFSKITGNKSRTTTRRRARRSRTVK